MEFYSFILLKSLFEINGRGQSRLTHFQYFIRAHTRIFMSIYWPIQAQFMLCHTLVKFWKTLSERFPLNSSTTVHPPCPISSHKRLAGKMNDCKTLSTCDSSSYSFLTAGQKGHSSIRESFQNLWKLQKLCTPKFGILYLAY